MHSFDSTFARMLAARLDEAESREVGNMTANYPNAANAALYPYHVGVIHGLRMVRTFCDQVQAELNKST